MKINLWRLFSPFLVERKCKILLVLSAHKMLRSNDEEGNKFGLACEKMQLFAKDEKKRKKNTQIKYKTRAVGCWLNWITS